MYKVYTYTVYIKSIYLNGKVLILFASEMKQVIVLLLYAHLGLVSFFSSP